jgi:hypothetical protein
MPRTGRAGRWGQRETDFTSGQLNCGSERLEAAKLQILNNKEFGKTIAGFLAVARLTARRKQHGNIPDFPGCRPNPADRI